MPPRKKPDELDGMPEHPPEMPTVFSITNVKKFRLQEGLANGDAITLIVHGMVIHAGDDLLEAGGDDGDGEPKTRPSVKIRATSIVQK